jgi:protease YdgD
VLDRSGYRAKIVSIISAGGDYEGKPIAFGMELPVMVNRLKAALRRGEATSVAGSAKEAEPEGGTMPGTPAKRITIGGPSDGGAKFVSP